MGNFPETYIDPMFLNVFHEKPAKGASLFLLVRSLDHETAIMHRLQTVILEHTKVLMDVMECCAELDW